MKVIKKILSLFLITALIWPSPSAFALAPSSPLNGLSPISPETLQVFANALHDFQEMPTVENLGRLESAMASHRPFVIQITHGFQKRAGGKEVCNWCPYFKAPAHLPEPWVVATLREHNDWAWVEFHAAKATEAVLQKKYTDPADKKTYPENATITLRGLESKNPTRISGREKRRVFKSEEEKRQREETEQKFKRGFERLEEEGNGEDLSVFKGEGALLTFNPGGSFHLVGQEGHKRGKDKKKKEKTKSIQLPVNTLRDEQNEVLGGFDVRVVYEEVKESEEAGVARLSFYFVHSDTPMTKGAVLNEYGEVEPSKVLKTGDLISHLDFALYGSQEEKEDSDLVEMEFRGLVPKLGRAEGHRKTQEFFRDVARSTKVPVRITLKGREGTFYGEEGAKIRLHKTRVPPSEGADPFWLRVKVEQEDLKSTDFGDSPGEGDRAVGLKLKLIALHDVRLNDGKLYQKGESLAEINLRRFEDEKEERIAQRQTDQLRTIGEARLYSFILRKILFLLRTGQKEEARRYLRGMGRWIRDYEKNSTEYAFLFALPAFLNHLLAGQSALLQNGNGIAQLNVNDPTARGRQLISHYEAGGKWMQVHHAETNPYQDLVGPDPSAAAAQIAADISEADLSEKMDRGFQVVTCAAFDQFGFKNEAGGKTVPVVMALWNMRQALDPRTGGLVVLGTHDEFSRENARAMRHYFGLEVVAPIRRNMIFSSKNLLANISRLQVGTLYRRVRNLSGIVLKRGVKEIWETDGFKAFHQKRPKLDPKNPETIRLYLESISANDAKTLLPVKPVNGHKEFTPDQALGSALELLVGEAQEGKISSRVFEGDVSDLPLGTMTGAVRVIWDETLRAADQIREEEIRKEDPAAGKEAAIDKGEKKAGEKGERKRPEPKIDSPEEKTPAPASAPIPAEAEEIPKIEPTPATKPAEEPSRLADFYKSAEKGKTLRTHKEAVERLKKMIGGLEIQIAQLARLIQERPEIEGRLTALVGQKEYLEKLLGYLIENKTAHTSIQDFILGFAGPPVDTDDIVLLKQYPVDLSRDPLLQGALHETGMQLFLSLLNFERNLIVFHADYGEAKEAMLAEMIGQAVRDNQKVLVTGKSGPEIDRVLAAVARKTGNVGERVVGCPTGRVDSPAMKGDFFDICFVLDGRKLDEPELLLTASKAAAMVLFADPFNVGALGPVEKKLRSLNVEPELFEPFAVSAIHDLAARFDSVLLGNITRFPAWLVKFLSGPYYAGALEPRQTGPVVFPPVVLQETNLSEEKNVSGECVNPQEAQRAAEQVRQWRAAGVPDSQISVLVPCEAQGEEIRGRLGLPDEEVPLNGKSREGIRIAVVDEYDEHEDPYVVISFVHSNQQKEIGPWRNLDRVISALTRAQVAGDKGQLVLLLDPDTFCETAGAFYGQPNYPVKELFTKLVAVAKKEMAPPAVPEPAPPAPPAPETPAVEVPQAPKAAAEREETLDEIVSRFQKAFDAILKRGMRTGIEPGVAQEAKGALIKLLEMRRNDPAAQTKIDPLIWNFTAAMSPVLHVTLNLPQDQEWIDVVDEILLSQWVKDESSSLQIIDEFARPAEKLLEILEKGELEKEDIIEINRQCYFFQQACNPTAPGTPKERRAIADFRAILRNHLIPRFYRKRFEPHMPKIRRLLAYHDDWGPDWLSEEVRRHYEPSLKKAGFGIAALSPYLFMSTIEDVFYTLRGGVAVFDPLGPVPIPIFMAYSKIEKEWDEFLKDHATWNKKKWFSKLEEAEKLLRKHLGWIRSNEEIHYYRLPVHYTGISLTWILHKLHNDFMTAFSKMPTQMELVQKTQGLRDLLKPVFLEAELRPVIKAANFLCDGEWDHVILFWHQATAWPGFVRQEATEAAARIKALLAAAPADRESLKKEVAAAARFKTYMEIPECQALFEGIDLEGLAREFAAAEIKVTAEAVDESKLVPSDQALIQVELDAFHALGNEFESELSNEEIDATKLASFKEAVRKLLRLSREHPGTESRIGRAFYQKVHLISQAYVLTFEASPDEADLKEIDRIILRQWEIEKAAMPENKRKPCEELIREIEEMLLLLERGELTREKFFETSMRCETIRRAIDDNGFSSEVLPRLFRSRIEPRIDLLRKHFVYDESGDYDLLRTVQLFLFYIWGGELFRPVSPAITTSLRSALGKEWEALESKRGISYEGIKREVARLIEKQSQKVESSASSRDRERFSFVGMILAVSKYAESSSKAKKICSREAVRAKNKLIELSYDDSFISACVILFKLYQPNFGREDFKEWWREACWRNYVRGDAEGTRDQLKILFAAAAADDDAIRRRLLEAERFLPFGQVIKNGIFTNLFVENADKLEQAIDSAEEPVERARLRSIAEALAGKNLFDSLERDLANLPRYITEAGEAADFFNKEKSRGPALIVKDSVHRLLDIRKKIGESEHSKNVASVAAIDTALRRLADLMDQIYFLNYDPEKDAPYSETLDRIVVDSKEHVFNDPRFNDDPRDEENDKTNMVARLHLDRLLALLEGGGLTRETAQPFIDGLPEWETDGYPLNRVVWSYRHRLEKHMAALRKFALEEIGFDRLEKLKRFESLLYMGRRAFLLQPLHARNHADLDEEMLRHFEAAETEAGEVDKKIVGRVGGLTQKEWVRVWERQHVGVENQIDVLNWLLVNAAAVLKKISSPAERRRFKAIVAGAHRRDQILEYLKKDYSLRTLLCVAPLLIDESQDAAAQTRQLWEQIVFGKTASAQASIPTPAAQTEAEKADPLESEARAAIESLDQFLERDEDINPENAAEFKAKYKALADLHDRVEATRLKTAIEKSLALADILFQEAFFIFAYEPGESERLYRKHRDSVIQNTFIKEIKEREAYEKIMGMMDQIVEELKKPERSKEFILDLVIKCNGLHLEMINKSQEAHDLIFYHARKKMEPYVDLFMEFLAFDVGHDSQSLRRGSAFLSLAMVTSPFYYPSGPEGEVGSKTEDDPRWFDLRNYWKATVLEAEIPVKDKEKRAVALFNRETAGLAARLEEGGLSAREKYHLLSRFDSLIVNIYNFMMCTQEPLESLKQEIRRKKERLIPLMEFGAGYLSILRIGEILEIPSEEEERIWRASLRNGMQMREKVRQILEEIKELLRRPKWNAKELFRKLDLFGNYCTFLTASYSSPIFEEYRDMFEERIDEIRTALLEIPHEKIRSGAAERVTRFDWHADWIRVVRGRNLFTGKRSENCGKIETRAGTPLQELLGEIDERLEKVGQGLRDNWKNPALEEREVLFYPDSLEEANLELEGGLRVLAREMIFKKHEKDQIKKIRKFFKKYQSRFSELACRGLRAGVYDILYDYFPNEFINPEEARQEIRRKWALLREKKPHPGIPEVMMHRLYPLLSDERALLDEANREKITQCLLALVHESVPLDKEHPRNKLARDFVNGHIQSIRKFILRYRDAKSFELDTRLFEIRGVLLFQEDTTMKNLFSMTSRVVEEMLLPQLQRTIETGAKDWFQKGCAYFDGESAASFAKLIFAYVYDSYLRNRISTSAIESAGMRLDDSKLDDASMKFLFEFNYRHFHGPNQGFLFSLIERKGMDPFQDGYKMNVHSLLKEIDRLLEMEEEEIVILKEDWVAAIKPHLEKLHRYVDLSLPGNLYHEEILGLIRAELKTRLGKILRGLSGMDDLPLTGPVAQMLEALTQEPQRVSPPVPDETALDVAV